MLFYMHQQWMYVNGHQPSIDDNPLIFLLLLMKQMKTDLNLFRATSFQTLFNSIVVVHISWWSWHKFFFLFAKIMNFCVHFIHLLFFQNKESIERVYQGYYGDKILNLYCIVLSFWSETKSRMNLNNKWARFPLYLHMT